MSLNNFLWKGTNLTNSLVETLLRFRLYRMALTADIEEAFRRVKIKEDRRYLRLFYLHNPEDEDQVSGQLAVYRFNVNTLDLELLL